MGFVLADVLPVDAGVQKFLAPVDPTTGLFAMLRGVGMETISAKSYAWLGVASGCKTATTHAAAAIDDVGTESSAIDVQGFSKLSFLLDTGGAGANTVEAKLYGRLTSAGADYELGTIVAAQAEGQRQGYLVSLPLAPYVTVKLTASAGSVTCTGTLYCQA